MPLAELATAGRYLLSIPERTFGIRLGTEMAREDIGVRPRGFLPRLYRIYGLFGLFTGGTIGELTAPSIFEVLHESDIPDHEQKNTPFSRLISSGVGGTISGATSALTDLGVLAVTGYMFAHGNPEQAALIKLAYNAGSHVLVDALKAGVNNFPHFGRPQTPIAAF